jgi:hypothetical protein
MVNISDGWRAKTVYIFDGWRAKIIQHIWGLQSQNGEYFSVVLEIQRGKNIFGLDNQNGINYWRSERQNGQHICGLENQ